MPKTNLKKIIIGAILAGLLVFTVPKTAEAGLPVIDYTLVTKEYVLDTIAWTLAKSLAGNLLQSTTQWVKTGFEGNPLFVTDLGRFALDAANDASGIFLEEYLQKDTYNSLCQPWRNPIHLALTRANTGLLNSKKYKPQCTLADVVNNASKMTDFMNDFQKGGWEAWGSLTASPANNPIGAYLDGLDAMDQASAQAKATAEKEAQMGQGFIGQKKCLDRTPEGLCKEWTTESPGSWVGNQLAGNTTSGIRSLELADELNELVAALVSQASNWMLNGIRTSSTGGSPGPSPVSTDAVSETSRQDTLNLIDSAIDDEAAYQKTKKDILNTYSQAATLYSAAKSCLETLGEKCGQSGSALDYANRQAAKINSEIIPTVSQEIADSKTTVSSFKKIKTKIQNASTGKEFSNLYNEFALLRQNSHNSYDQYKADQELEKAEQAKQDAQTQINSCQTLLATCASQATVTGP